MPHPPSQQLWLRLYNQRFLLRVSRSDALNKKLCTLRAGKALYLSGYEKDED